MDEFHKNTPVRGRASLKLSPKGVRFMKAKVIKLLHLLGVDVWILSLVEKLLKELNKKVKAWKRHIFLS